MKYIFFYFCKFSKKIVLSLNWLFFSSIFLEVFCCIFWPVQVSLKMRSSAHINLQDRKKGGYIIKGVTGRLYGRMLIKYYFRKNFKTLFWNIFGVPQGSVLGPHFFISSYTVDLFLVFNKFTIILFEDDTTYCNFAL